MYLDDLVCFNKDNVGLFAAVHARGGCGGGVWPGQEGAGGSVQGEE